jgi:hypothetical protein
VKQHRSVAATGEAQRNAIDRLARIVTLGTSVDDLDRLAPFKLVVMDWHSSHRLFSQGLISPALAQINVNQLQPGKAAGP